MINRNRRLTFYIFLVFFILAASFFQSCASAAQRLVAPRSSIELRLDDIADLVPGEDEKAIHLLQAFLNIYGPNSFSPSSPDVLERAGALQEAALSSLVSRQAQALSEKRWEDAASLTRSLEALGQISEADLGPAEIALEEARTFLERGEDLAAFIAALRSSEYGPLPGKDAELFLKRAVEARQRRSAAFFLRAVEIAGLIPSESEKSYASGRDEPSQMIKGVATVWVDRGIKINKGRGEADRVIGSAFFVDKSGLLVTNYHVVASEVDPKYEGYSRMYIRMGDASSARIPAKVIGWDQAMDLALIKAEFVPEYVFSVLDGVEPEIGDHIFAIGSPAGLEKTVTSGIVSARGRRFLQIGDVVQIDAAVNHGNSGGPVVDSQGRLAGVVFAGIEQFEGINFAVPVARLTAALPALLRGGKAERPWLGFSLNENREGIEIIYISPNTPASEISAAEGTYLKTLAGFNLSSLSGGIATLQDLLFSRRPGELVSYTTSDGRSFVSLLASRPPLPLALAARSDTRERMAGPLFGLLLSPAHSSLLDPEYTVKKVLRGSVSDEAGLSENDPVSIRGFKVDEENGYALMDIFVKKRRMGYLETMMRLPALLDSPDTL
ncbi:S1C family serine protease [Treponema sp.]